MAKSSPEPTDLPEDQTSAQPGSVYYQQKSAPRKRYTPSQRQTEPAPKKTKTRQTSGNLGHAILQANIRTFSLVALFMFGLMGFAVYITGKMWARQQSKVELTGPAISRSAPPSSIAPDVAPLMGVMLEGSRDPVKPNVRTELDTDAMRKAISMSKRAEVLASSGNLKEAIDRYQDALEIWPYLTQVWAQLGRIYLETRDYGRAQIALERAVENDPANAKVLNDLGVALLYQNRVDRALEIFDTVNAIDSNFAPAHFNRALCYLSKDDTESAERALDQFLRQQPNDPRALKERAYLLANAGDYQQALAHLRTAMSSTPDWAPLYFDAAACAALLGRVDDAIRYLDKAEGLTTPGVVYRMYQQPAFREIRLTEAGRLFEENLAERGREMLAIQPEGEEPVAATEPIYSATQTP